MAKLRRNIINYEPLTQLESFYTGGDIEWTSKGDSVITQCGDEVAFTSLDHSSEKRKLSIEEDPILNFAIDNIQKFIITSHKSGLLRQWLFEDLKLVRTWKSLHIGPIKKLIFDNSGTLLASAGTDSVIKIWDIYKQYCTHHLKGGFGIFSCLCFHPHLLKPFLYAAGNDLKIRGWNLNTSKQDIELEGHYGHVTGIVVLNDNKLISCGRDKVLLIWDLEGQCLLKTLVSSFPLECMVVYKRVKNSEAPDRKECVVTGDETGQIIIWDVHAYEKLDSHKELSVSCSSLKFNPELDILDVCHSDQTIIRHQCSDLSSNKKFVGHNDEILSLCFVGQRNHALVIATNSPVLKLYQTSDFSCELLYGHTDIVLCVSSWKSDTNHFVSSSKDNSIRVWLLVPEENSAVCICVGTGHTSSITTVATNFLSFKFLVSGSEDQCIKCYSLKKKDKDMQLIVKATQVAHDKTINSVAISPNDKIIATGSQDHTAKLWAVDSLTAIGTLRGHKKGVWAVKFSEVDQIVATGSADTNIKLWSVSDFSCLKTFQGHEGSVHTVLFVNIGTQIVSAGGEGFLKLWDIKSNQCLKTFSHHEDRIWDLVSKEDGDILITGGADSKLIIWKNVSEEEATKAQEELEKKVQEEQALQNYIFNGKFKEALLHCIQLGRPFQALNVIKKIMHSDSIFVLSEALNSLNYDRLMQLMEFCVIWNSNSRHCYAAQAVLEYIMEHVHPNELLTYPNINNVIQQLLPYLERHLSRYSKLQESLHFLNYSHYCLSLTGWREAEATEATSGNEQISNLLNEVLENIDVKEEIMDIEPNSAEKLDGPPQIIESYDSDEGSNDERKPLLFRKTNRKLTKKVDKRIKR